MSWLEFDHVEPAAPLTQHMTFTMEVATRTALDERIPLVFVISSAGANIGEGIAPLHGWGRVARALMRCSGVVPTIAILDGPAVSGPALLLGMVDLVVATERAYAFVNGPVMVRQFTGIDVTKEELGAPTALDRNAGLTASVVTDRAEAEQFVSALLEYLPDHLDAEPPVVAAVDPPDRSCPTAGELIPESS
ncbi:MAG: carboxyl transferase domain-containing protein, partial [Ilumatobacteraceae bacterium]